MAQLKALGIDAISLIPDFPLSPWVAGNGKEADFRILEGDPHKVSPNAIADIKVSETWVAGERKFAA
jgi:hypothetical protein